MVVFASNIKHFRPLCRLPLANVASDSGFQQETEYRRKRWRVRYSFNTPSSLRSQKTIMTSTIATSTLLLSFQARFTRSLTSAVKLADKTKSPKHIAFAETLLKIKKAAPDTHLESLTRFKAHPYSHARSHEQRIREDKYQYLGNALERVKKIRQFLDGFSSTQQTPPSPVITLRREVNQHLTQSYENTSRVYAVKAAIYAISQKVGQKKRTVTIENFKALTSDIHTMVDAGKPLGEIVNKVIDFKVYHRLKSLP